MGGNLGTLLSVYSFAALSCYMVSLKGSSGWGLLFDGAAKLSYKRTFEAFLFLNSVPYSPAERFFFSAFPILIQNA